MNVAHIYSYLEIIRKIQIGKSSFLKLQKKRINKYYTLLGLGAITNMIKTNNPSSFSYQNGLLITTLMDIANTQMQVINNTNGALSYYGYLNNFKFSHSQTVGDVYHGECRLLLPNAYNINIKRVK